MSSDQRSADPTTPMAFERQIRGALIIAAIAMVGYLGLAASGDRALMLDGLGRLHPWQWLTLLGLSLFNYALRFLRWHGYLLALGSRVRWWPHLMIYLAGFAFTVSPGKAGEAVRSVYLRAEGVPWSQSLATLTLERLLDLAAMVMLATLALSVFADYAWAASLLVLTVAGGLFLATRPGVIQAVLERLPATRRDGKVARGIAAVLQDSRRLLAPAPLLAGLLLGVVAWGAEALGFWFLLDWLGADFDPLRAMGTYAVSMLAGAASFLPGGVGGAEAAMVALVLAGGAEMGTAVLATVICRAATLWFAVALGIGTLMLIARRRASSLD